MQAVNEPACALSLVYDAWQQVRVDPVIFGVIYVGAIPFSWASVAWLVRNVRTGRSPVLPALSAAFFFLSVYFYVIPVGHNVPAWVYGAAGLMLVVGAWSTIRSIRVKLNRAQAGEETV